MKKYIFFIVISSYFFLLSAQQHRERWEATDYFPKHYFVHIFDDGDTLSYDHLAGEVAFYMRLAGLKSWKDTVVDEDETWLRLSVLPEYSHPLFIEVAISADTDVYYLRFSRGTAICGYVEHSTYYEMSDTGFYDATEKRYHGNQWTEGAKIALEDMLSLIELDSLKRLLAEVDMPNQPHITRCTGFQPNYILEYRHGKTYNAVYDECYGKPLGTLVNYLLFLADSSCVDMVIHTPNKRNGIVPAQFPGGDSALNAFLAANLHFPQRALADLEESSESIRFVVERDGSLYLIEGCQEDGYGFCAEAQRLFSLMPPWQPATKNGKAVRSEARFSVRFHLPDSLQPVYGNNPRLETMRDTNKWNTILMFNRSLIRNPQDQSNLYRMGVNYYHEFLLPHEPQRPLNSLDTFLVEELSESWDAIRDRTPVVEGAADSALHYFYRALTATDGIDPENFISMYLPIRQLEQYLGLPHNPLNQLPYDTLPGMYYPCAYFVDLPADGILDTMVDYSDYDVLLSSYFWVKAMSHTLTEMYEPVLFDKPLPPGDTLFRCAFYPSFHPPLSFRIEHTASGNILYWKKLDYTVDEHTWKTTYHPHEGQRKLNKKEYRQFLMLLNAMDFEHICRMHHVTMLDGAQWCIERRTADTFKAHFTNMAGEKYAVLYSYLIQLAGIEADYADSYY